MRTIGNLLFLPLLAVFGFGFLLAYSFDISQELTETKGQLSRMQEELWMLDAQYQAVVEEKNLLAEQNVKFVNENADLQTQIETLEIERQMLINQLESLQEKQAFIEKSSPALMWLSSFSVEGVATMLGVPMLPISLGTIYLITRVKRTNLPAPPVHGGGQTTFQVLLTRDEIQLIAKHRRSSQPHDQSD